MSYLLFSHTTLIVLIGTLFLGAMAGALGVFIVLRRYSLIADAVSHAALPGIVISCFVMNGCYSLSAMIGGMATGALGIGLVLYIKKNSLLKIDGLLGVILSAFFGLGILLLSWFAKINTAGHGMIHKMLLGNAALVLVFDVYVIALVAMIVIITLFCFYRLFYICAFDPLYAQSIGYCPWWIDLLLIALLLAVVAVGMPLVGVVLMSSLLVAPGVAARQWTKSCHTMVILSFFFGAGIAVLGVFLSHNIKNMATGPVIGVVGILAVFISLLCAIPRGILWQRYIQKRDR